MTQFEQLRKRLVKKVCTVLLKKKRKKLVEWILFALFGSPEKGCLWCAGLGGELALPLSGNL